MNTLFKPENIMIQLTMVILIDIIEKVQEVLSGGAIAGIVIACVVVLAAASIAAIMLRKPSPPIDNTTVVGLKTADNI